MGDEFHLNLSWKWSLLGCWEQAGLGKGRDTPEGQQTPALRRLSSTAHHSYSQFWLTRSIGSSVGCLDGAPGSSFPSSFFLEGICLEGSKLYHSMKISLENGKSARLICVPAYGKWKKRRERENETFKLVFVLSGKTKTTGRACLKAEATQYWWHTGLAVCIRVCMCVCLCACMFLSVCAVDRGWLWDIFLSFFFTVCLFRNDRVFHWASSPQYWGWGPRGPRRSRMCLTHGDTSPLSTGGFKIRMDLYLQLWLSKKQCPIELPILRLFCNVKCPN